MDLNLPLSDSDRGKLQVHIHFEHLAPDLVYANEEAVAKPSCLHFYARPTGLLRAVWFPGVGWVVTDAEPDPPLVRYMARLHSVGA